MRDRCICVCVCVRGEREHRYIYIHVCVLCVRERHIWRANVNVCVDPRPSHFLIITQHNIHTHTPTHTHKDGSDYVSGSQPKVSYAQLFWCVFHKKNYIAPPDWMDFWPNGVDVCVCVCV